MKVLSIRLQFCWKLTAIAFSLLTPTFHAQASHVHTGAEPEEHLRSRLFIYDMHDGSSRLVYTADSIWEAPNWSPDGKYLISNSEGGIYKLILKPDGTAEPQKLAIPAEYRCNNDKAVSPMERNLPSRPPCPPTKVRKSFSLTPTAATSN